MTKSKFNKSTTLDNTLWQAAKWSTQKNVVAFCDNQYEQDSEVKNAWPEEIYTCSMKEMCQEKMLYSNKRNLCVKPSSQS